MKQDFRIEDRLESLGDALRQNPSVVEHVMDDVRKTRVSIPAVSSERMSLKRWLPLTTTAVAAMIVVGLALLLVPSSSSWADVVNAVNDREWLRADITNPDAPPRTVWMSMRGKIFASKGEDRIVFYDGNQMARFEYRSTAAEIHKFALGEQETPWHFPVDAIEAGAGPSLWGTETFTRGARHEVFERGTEWIEYDLKLHRGDMTEGRLRIDRATMLPVSLVFASSKDSRKVVTWSFDYPDEGPTSIFELGVARDTPLVDQMPPNEAREIFAAVAAAREQFGDFQLAVEGLPQRWFVYRRGSKWRIDADAGGILQKWVCNGHAVYANRQTMPQGAPMWVLARTTPSGLMSGVTSAGLPQGIRFASIVYPDFLARPTLQLAFDPRPIEMPGCVLVKISAELAMKEPTTGNEWYYLDPMKGYAVVRAELFNLPANVKTTANFPERRQSFKMEDFRQSPTGIWYAGVIRERNVFLDGNGIERRSESTHRYEFNFDAPLPDSLFEPPPGFEDPAKPRPE